MKIVRDNVHVDAKSFTNLYLFFFCGEGKQRSSDIAREQPHEYRHQKGDKEENQRYLRKPLRDSNEFLHGGRFSF